MKIIGFDEFMTVTRQNGLMAGAKKIPIALVLVAALLLCAGCITRSATLVEFSTGEVIRASFSDSPSTGGTVQVKMPDGEVLSGRYSAVRGTDHVSFSSSTMFGTVGSGASSTSVSGTGFSTGRTVGGQGRAYALLTSDTPGSTLVMEVIVTYGVLDGRGFGEARTNDGRHYKVQF